MFEGDSGQALYQYAHLTLGYLQQLLYFAQGAYFVYIIGLRLFSVHMMLCRQNYTPVSNHGLLDGFY